MTKSRKQRVSDPRERLGELAPHLRRMQQVDEAERAGEAERALELMEQMPTDPDGKPFWRPWRVERLFQLAMFGSVLPGWALSRWLLEQTLQDLDERRQRQVLEAERIAVGLRAGAKTLPGRDAVDARGRVRDRDWVYRQCVLYELGGLRHFLTRRADRRLVERADRVREWAWSPMGGYRLLDRQAATTTWHDLATGAPVVTANIGSAALVGAGECVIGRLVPIEGGRMFETVPLVVPPSVAQRVAADSSGWVEALREGVWGGADIRIVGHRFGLLSDVSPTVAALTLYSEETLRGGADAAREVLAAAAEQLEDPDDDPDNVDVWACLAAAVLDPTVFAELSSAAGPADADLLARLGDTLAEPAAGLCRELAARVRRAA